MSPMLAASYTDSSIISLSYSKYSRSFTLSAILTKAPGCKIKYSPPIPFSVLTCPLYPASVRRRVHRTVETLFILVEDVGGGIIHFHISFVLRQRYAEAEHNVTITVPMFRPVLPNYYISVVSDRWLHSDETAHLVQARYPPRKVTTSNTPP